MKQEELTFYSHQLLLHDPSVWERVLLHRNPGRPSPCSGNAQVESAGYCWPPSPRNRQQKDNLPKMPGSYPWNLPLSKNDPRQTEHNASSATRKSSHFKRPKLKPCENRWFTAPILQKCQRSVWWHCDNNRMHADDRRRQGSKKSWPYVVFVRPASHARLDGCRRLLSYYKIDYSAIKLFFSSVSSWQFFQ